MDNTAALCPACHLRVQRENQKSQEISSMLKLELELLVNSRLSSVS